MNIIFNNKEEVKEYIKKDEYGLYKNASNYKEVRRDIDNHNK